MNNISRVSDLLSEAANATMALKKELEGPDFGFTEQGGNGRVKKNGKNLVIYDSFYYGENEALKNHIKKWSPGGTYAKYFDDEHGWKIKVVKSGSELKSKVYKNKLGAVWVEVEVR